MRVLKLVALSTLGFGILGQPARADDRAHIETGSNIEQETDQEWLRLACPNHLADEAKRREAAMSTGRDERGAVYAKSPAVTKCEKALAGTQS